MKGKEIIIPSAKRGEMGFDVALVFGGMGGRLPAGNVFGPTVCPCYLLQYCVEGRGKLETEEGTFTVEKGQCFVTFPGQVRVERADEANPWKLIWLGFDGESTAQWIDRLGVTADAPVLQYWGESRLPVSLQTLIETADTVGYQRKFLLGSRILTFFDECLQAKEAAEDNGNPVSVSDSYVEQAVYYLNMHFTDHNTTIEGLADYLGLNRSYLYEIFKAKMGESPQEYLTGLRISKACEYLLLPQATVTSVAHALGYEISVFSKAFKNRVGVTPSEYIKGKER